MIQKIYENAKSSGDPYVYFVDGESCFGTTNRESCTVDGFHPNDLGFLRMAETIYPVLKRIIR
ncbi:SGNH/GDSL hydrolase family protein [Paenibacillus sp. LjRoot56]|uniref:SGNH/GDSL hydrolase family protein n=1 Tax=Paenibacillus sp. LjRoot56 TaxID=3342333 RepID=UPI003ED0A011